MKNWLKILLIASLLINSFTYGFSAQAQISAFNIEISDIKDGQAILKWYSNQAVRSEVYFGEEVTNLNQKVVYNTYKTNHEARLYGLEDDKDYFYQINLYNSGGEKLSLYPRLFNTDDMEDTKAPYFIDLYTIQVAGNAVALGWEASEKVYATIEYYKDGHGDDRKSKKASGYKQENYAFIYGLDNRSEYYFRVTLEDKAGNKKTDAVATNISGTFDKNNALEIKNIEPTSSDSTLVGYNQTTIKFESSLAAKSYIKYGTQANRLSKTVYINKDTIDTKHEITLNDLEPNTTYYYNIYINGSFYNKKATVEGLSFKTKGGVLGVKEDAVNDDKDHDQLSNSLEMALGTDPSDPDTDNDGYRDGTEVINGYNPLGAGKWNSPIQFFYGQPRLDLDYEKTKALELKKIVDQKLKYIYINPSKWNMLVNAYTYGNYPAEAIIMYIKLDGKTVHPEIPWDSWKNSSEYKKYEKYIK